MVRFSVSDTAAVLLAGGAASCARAAMHDTESRTAIHATRRSPRISLLLPASLASLTFKNSYQTLLIPQRFDRLKTRCLVRRQIAKKKSRRTRNQKRDNHAQTRHRNAQIAGQKWLDCHGNRQP